jgi:hypothetical protein
MEDYKEEPGEPVETKKPEKDIVDRVLKLKKQYEESTQDSRKEYSEIYSVYMGKTDEVQKTPYLTTDDIPKLRTEVAYIVPFIYSGEPEVEIVPIGDEDSAISKIYEKIVNHRFRTIKDFNSKIEAWVDVNGQPVMDRSGKPGQSIKYAINNAVLVQPVKPVETSVPF